ETIEAYMISKMGDVAHDCQHIYRVLYMAMDIAAHEPCVDMDILIAACLLHDIGREKQNKNPALCHASEGGAMAYAYLSRIGFGVERAKRVRECVASHRYRSENPPESVEAKILFDADKLDATGSVGIARTLLYGGRRDRPLYSMDDAGNVSDGRDTRIPSFFQEYHFKLKKVYDRLYTERGNQIAAERRQAAERFYADLLAEVQSAHTYGKTLLERSIS
ncbi:MAG: HD domain-containing protein, partial [Clostridia bacterium]|nr:HD domain-containing protein [Clostridia bacterium]